MDAFGKALNHSAAVTSYEDTHFIDDIMSNEQRLIVVVVNYVFLCTLVCLFGIMSNVINLIVLYKQGLDSSINITFFALAISDLSGLVFQLWLNITQNPLFESSDVPMMPSEFQYMTGGIPRVVFSRITCLITVYATLERCLCITFPLHIKQIITPRRTATVMITLYLFIFATVTPLYCRSSIGWKFYSDRNRTLLGLIFANNSTKPTEIFFIMQAVIGLVSFVSVVILTTILIRKLRQKSSWRQTSNVNQAKINVLSNRDRKTMSMVVLIASILIVCYTPSCILGLLNFFEPDFNVVGRYNNLFFATWSFGTLFDSINSSVNIFLYLKMSTKYRDTFYHTFVPNRVIDTAETS